MLDDPITETGQAMDVAIKGFAKLGEKLPVNSFTQLLLRGILWLKRSKGAKLMRAKNSRIEG
jgi:hypothetical protein